VGDVSLWGCGFGVGGGLEGWEWEWEWEWGWGSTYREGEEAEAEEHPEVADQWEDPHVCGERDMEIAVGFGAVRIRGVELFVATAGLADVAERAFTALAETIAPRRHFSSEAAFHRWDLLSEHSETGRKKDPTSSKTVLTLPLSPSSAVAVQSCHVPKTNCEHIDSSHFFLNGT